MAGTVVCRRPAFLLLFALLFLLAIKYAFLRHWAGPSRLHGRSWALSNVNGSVIEIRAPASDKALYEASKTKGKALYDILVGKSTAGATPFVQNEDLAKWGWTIARDSQTDADVQQQLKAVTKELNGLGLSMKGSENHVVDMHHTIATTHNSKPFPATRAAYQDIYNPSKGAIYAHWNYGPQYRIPKPDNNDLVGANPPDLQRWSDIIFLVWQHLTTPTQRRNLKFLWRLKIDPKSTTGRIIAYPLQKQIGTATMGAMVTSAPKWPGHTFTAVKDPEDFAAMLGSEHVRGVVYLLRQHEQSLGKKGFRRITVFFGGSGWVGGGQGGVEESEFAYFG